MARIESAVLACAALSLLIGSSCRREERRFSEPPPASRLNANPATAPSEDHDSLVRYSEDAWAISQGAQLYSQMNCEGCHGHGGGGAMGPPLMDSKWIYGGGLDEIEQTILGGRPRGMPAFRDRLSPQQVWQLVAYVRSLSGNVSTQVKPSRDDHMAVRPPISETSPEPPVKQKVD